jgi:alkylation response protein AidB-like acyl-CoA dehydrogenase
MAQYIADRKDIDFVLHEQLKVEELSRHAMFDEFNRKTIDMIITEARNVAIKEILPTNKLGDQEGCTFDNGNVKVPESFHRPWKILKEAGWVAMSESVEWGGQGLPLVVSLAVNNYVAGANPSLVGYAWLTYSAGILLNDYGTDQQKKLFLKNLFTGEWTGTMLLTEPDAGSDVGALTTTAVENDDGTYSLTGSKIFISSGEHDLANNIIHTVLARIEGAPTGAKGISLFLVPKIWVNDDGSLGAFNDVICTGIEHKMGAHGNATCSLTLGGNGQCRGTLLGEKHKGMRAMFVSMNAMRLLVGLGGLNYASSAYMYAVNYAKERIQGKHLLSIRDQPAPSVPIIQHPDVRRQLITMKVYVEGMRSLIYYVGLCEDKLKTTDDVDEIAKYQDLINLLVPIVKGYITDRAFEVCNHALQVYGGYGYISEYPMEQLVRDCRLTMIFEGTNGIQAMDLLGRKLGMNKGIPFMDLMGKIQKTIAEARDIVGLEGFAAEMEVALNKLGEAALHIGTTAMSDKVLNAFAFASPFMEVTGDILMSWMLLWRATIAARKLEKSDQKKDSAFYQGQVKSAEFFINSILPITLGKIKTIILANGATVEISEASFGG